MDVRSVLSELGLSEGEIKVYLALLKLGSTPVSKIKEETNLHRTTIYDFLEKLLNKGLMSYVIRNNVKYYSAAPPQKLFDFLKEKQDKLEQVLPELQKLHQFQQEEVKVEVYKGAEGLKTVMLECIKIGKETVGFGIDDGLFKKALPTFIEQYQRLLEEHNIHERLLAKMNAEYYFHTKQTKYKYLPADLFSPTSTLIYGNRIQIVMWEPSLMTIVVDNKKLAESYRRHFEALWNMESMIFRGWDEVKSLFWDMVETLKKGEEYTVFGVPPAADKYAPFFEEMMEAQKKKGVKARGIFDKRAVEQAEACRKFPHFKVRSLDSKYMSPAEVGIYGGKVMIVLWTDVPQGFLINNKKVADSFRQFFEFFWKMAEEQRKI